jgi:uncharacterized damage-inducible protein DinB
MYTKVSEFLQDWKKESETTLKVLSNLTDDSLKQKVTPEGRDIAYIAWHIVITIGEMMNKSGLSVDAPAEDSDPPASASEIKNKYESVAKSLSAEVETKWTDAMMSDELDLYGEKWKRSFLCEALVKHEIHHRGQLTILMRQAGLKVPGTYGPAKEEWSAYGMPEAR